VFDGCQGLALESVDGALLEDVTITNITMRDISSAPIFLRLGSRMRGPASAAVGTLKRIIISNIVCSNSALKIASIISGIPGHEIEDVKISDLYLQHKGGGTTEAAAIQPPEKEAGYPEPGMFGPMPANGFYIRHVKNVDLTNVEVATLQEDERPTFVLEDVQGADFFRIKAPAVKDAPMFVLRNVERFSVGRSKPVADTEIAKADRKSL
jgi:polygalacturonase